MVGLCMSFDKIWDEISFKSKNWLQNRTELRTLGIGKKAKPFLITEVTSNSLRVGVNSNEYFKTDFNRAVQLLLENGKTGAELRPIKTNAPIEGTIDYVLRPINEKGHRPPMKATWIGAILVHSGVALQIAEKPITIRLRDEYL